MHGIFMVTPTTSASAWHVWCTQELKQRTRKSCGTTSSRCSKQNSIQHMLVGALLDPPLVSHSCSGLNALRASNMLKAVGELAVGSWNTSACLSLTPWNPHSRELRGHLPCVMHAPSAMSAGTQAGAPNLATRDCQNWLQHPGWACWPVMARPAGTLQSSTLQQQSFEYRASCKCNTS